MPGWPTSRIRNPDPGELILEIRSLETKSSLAGDPCESPSGGGYEPVTLTTQVQLAGACTTNVCAPRVDCAVTDCPDGPVSLIAGVPVGDDPPGVTNTWNDGPAAGAGAH